MKRKQLFLLISYFWIFFFLLFPHSNSCSINQDTLWALIVKAVGFPVSAVGAFNLRRSTGEIFINNFINILIIIKQLLPRDPFMKLGLGLRHLLPVCTRHLDDVIDGKRFGEAKRHGRDPRRQRRGKAAWGPGRCRAPFKRYIRVLRTNTFQ